MGSVDNFKELILEYMDSALPSAIERERDISLENEKIYVIYGPRRSGKTFFCYQLIHQLITKGVNKDRTLYINFEDDRILPLSVTDLRNLIDAYYELYPHNQDEVVYLFLDEIQTIEGWETFVRRIYDKTEFRIIVTGSSSQLLIKDIASSLRGRTLRYSIAPTSFTEYLSFNNISHKPSSYKHSKLKYKIKNSLNNYLEFGRFPEIVNEKSPVIKQNILQEYFDLLVYRDLAEKHSIHNVSLLKHLLKFLFTNITKPFSIAAYAKLAKQDLSFSKDTISDYLSYIEDTGYFWLLPKFSYSLKEQRINPKKIITLDNGLRNKASMKLGADSGRLVENLVGALLCETNESVYYWKGKQEVDFIIQDSHKFIAINVTSDESQPDVLERELGGLEEFKKQFPHIEKLILITKEKEGQINDIQLIPLWLWLASKTLHC